MVTRPFSSVIGTLPIGGFENSFFFYFLDQRWHKKFWALLIDNPFNDGFMNQNFNISSAKRNEKWN